MTSDYEPNLTTIPTRTIVSETKLGNSGLGPTKVAARSTTDPAKELDPAEENYLRDACIYLMRYFGAMRTGETKDALPDRQMSIRDVAMALGNGDARRFYALDHFVKADSTMWTFFNGHVVEDVRRGCLKFALNAQQSSSSYWTKRHFYRAAHPVLEVRWNLEAADQTMPDIRVGFLDDGSGGDDGYGVAIRQANGVVKVSVFSAVAGAYAYTIVTAMPAIVADEWHIARVWLDGTPGAQTVCCRVDDEYEATEDSQIVADTALGPKVYVGAGTATGKFGRLDYIVVTADFGAADEVMA